MAITNSAFAARYGVALPPYGVSRLPAGPLLPFFPLIPLVLLMGLPRGATAADWLIAPTLRLRESVSDNGRLAPPGQAASERTSEITPGIVITGRGPDLVLDLAYAMQRAWREDGDDVSNHQLRAGAHAQLLEDWLYADAGASMAKRSISAFGPQALDPTQPDSNQATLTTRRFSPYLKHRIRGYATVQLRLTRESSRSDDDGTGDALSVMQNESLLTVASDDSGRNWGWNARYRRQDTDDAQQRARLSDASVSLHYAATPRLNLFGTAGLEDNDYGAADPSRQRAHAWSAGLSWHPSVRSSFTVSTGKRYFGKSYALDASRRSRRAVWALSYNEDITTSYSQSQLSEAGTASFLDQLWLASVPDALLRQQRIDNFLRYTQLVGGNAGLVSYFSHRFYLQKAWRMSLAATGPRQTLVLALQTTRRTAQTSSTADNALLGALESGVEDRTRQTGANAAWNLRLSPRSSLNLAGMAATIDSLSTGRKDNNLTISAGFSRTLQPKVTGAIEVRRIRHSSNRGGDFRENALSASLNLQL
jgi:uncharacterized protein (PEP-CTERM system associated)